ncbi:hypothetical protein ABK905_00520 [Acerihabitans sp. KWT182]|uniref:Uncharacterized protein n=1 Tax=Acerihabitans sp. KWT182 TaxID=3157919 RepID=A0AAU7QA05_9GAMM
MKFLFIFFCKDSINASFFMPEVINVGPRASLFVQALLKPSLYAINGAGSPWTASCRPDVHYIQSLLHALITGLDALVPAIFNICAKNSFAVNSVVLLGLDTVTP